MFFLCMYMCTNNFFISKFLHIFLEDRKVTNIVNKKSIEMRYIKQNYFLLVFSTEIKALQSSEDDNIQVNLNISFTG